MGVLGPKSLKTAVLYHCSLHITSKVTQDTRCLKHSLVG